MFQNVFCRVAQRTPPLHVTEQVLALSGLPKALNVYYILLTRQGNHKIGILKTPSHSIPSFFYLHIFLGMEKEKSRRSTASGESQALSTCSLLSYYAHLTSPHCNQMDGKKMDQTFILRLRICSLMTNQLSPSGSRTIAAQMVTERLILAFLYRGLLENTMEL